MTTALQLIATLSAALFAGAALYINVAEHPARMMLDTKSAVIQWAPSYHRATWLQAPLALVSFVSGVAVALMSSSLIWFSAALLIGVVVPFTFIVVMPTNKKLLDTTRDLASPETRALLVKWNRLHSVRTVLSGLASVIYFCAWRMP